MTEETTLRELTDGRIRTELIVARKRLGMNQEQAAEIIGVSTTSWARWERGQQSIRAAYWTRIGEHFGVDVATMERADGAPRLPFWVTSDFFRTSLPDTLDMVTEWWRWDMDPSRRHVLAALPWLPPALREWLVSWSFDPAEASTASPRGERSVGLEDVRRVREATQAFDQMDHQFGAGLARPAVAHFLDAEVTPLLRGAYSEQVGAQLLSAAAAMTTVSGWMAHDLGRQGLAQQQLGHALRLAKASGDRMTAVCVLRDMYNLALNLRDPIWAVRCARAALQTAQRAEACPRVMAWLLLHDARATALKAALADTADAHAARRVRRLIGQAEKAFERIGPGDDEPPWAYFFTEAVLVAETGCCWRLIGEHDRAAVCHERALGGFGDRMVRPRLFHQVHSAEAYLGQGELERSLAAAREAVPIANTLTSPRAVQHIRDFDATLKPHQHEPRVRQWREYLRTELRTAPTGLGE